MLQLPGYGAHGQGLGQGRLQVVFEGTGQEIGVVGERSYWILIGKLIFLIKLFISYFYHKDECDVLLPEQLWMVGDCARRVARGGSQDGGSGSLRVRSSRVSSSSGSSSSACSGNG